MGTRMTRMAVICVADKRGFFLFFCVNLPNLHHLRSYYEVNYAQA